MPRPSYLPDSLILRLRDTISGILLGQINHSRYQGEPVGRCPDEVGRVEDSICATRTGSEVSRVASPWHTRALGRASANNLSCSCVVSSIGTDLGHPNPFLLPMQWDACDVTWRYRAYSARRGPSCIHASCHTSTCIRIPLLPYSLGPTAFAPTAANLSRSNDRQIADLAVGRQRGQ